MDKKMSMNNESPPNSTPPFFSLHFPHFSFQFYHLNLISSSNFFLTIDQDDFRLAKSIGSRRDNSHMI